MAEVARVISKATETVESVTRVVDRLLENHRTLLSRVAANERSLEALQRSNKLARDLLTKVNAFVDQGGGSAGGAALRDLAQAVDTVNACMADLVPVLDDLEVALLHTFPHRLRIVGTIAAGSRTGKRLTDSIRALVPPTSFVLSALVDLFSLLAEQSLLSAHTAAGRADVFAGRADVFTPRFEVPSLAPNVLLDFSTRDWKGRPVTTEGRVKDVLLRSVASPKRATVVAIGLAGMGGAGKTTVLIGLAWEEDLRKAFLGGIYFLHFGPDAQESDFVNEVARVVRSAGALKLSAAIDEMENLKEAVSAAADWFAGKPSLFLLDDLYSERYLDDMRQLLSTCNKSAMVVATRDRRVAFEVGDVVQIDGRDPRGRLSRSILLKYAGISDISPSSSTELEDALRLVLDRCDGIPLALAVAGRSIRSMTGGHGGDWRAAILNFAKDLIRDYSVLFEDTIGSHASLHASLRSSLRILQQWFEASEEFGNTVPLIDLFVRLCVFRKQAQVPVSVLQRLWNLGEERHVLILIEKLTEMSLLVRLKGTDGQFYVAIHDLVLDFCRLEAGDRMKAYHSDFLDGYLRRGQVEPEGETTVVEAVATLPLLPDGEEETARPWWSNDVPGDIYIYAHLAWHLVESGNAVELGGLLTDARWTLFRLRVGGLSALDKDFEQFLTGERMISSEESSKKNTVEGWHLVKRAIGDAWQFILENPSEIAFQMLSRLLDMDKGMLPVQRYLASVREWVARPWLRPFTRCWSCRGAFLRMEISLGAELSSAAVTDSFQCAVAGVGTALVIVNLETWTIIRALEGHSKPVSCLSISSDGRRIFSGSHDATLRIWDTTTGEAVGEQLRGHTDSVTCVAVSPDGRWVVSGSSDCTVRMWDTASGEAVGEPLLGHDDSVNCVAISPDGRRIVSGSDDGTLRIWYALTGVAVGEPLRDHTDRVNCVAVSADGRMIVSGSSDETIRVWDMESATAVLEPFRGHSDQVSSLSISGGGRRIVSGSHDATLRIWDTTTGEAVGEPLRGHTGSVTCVAVSTDGGRVLSGSLDHTLRAWDIAVTRGELPTGHSDAVSCVAMAPNSQSIVSGSVDWSLRIWDMRSGEAIGEPLLGHTGSVSCIAISADGSRIVSGSHDDTLRLWDMETGSAVGEPLRGHDDWVKCVAISADGRRLVSGSYDGSLRAWDMTTGEAIGEAAEEHRSAVSHIEISAGNTVTSYAGDEAIRWRLDEGLGLVWLDENVARGYRQKDGGTDVSGDYVECDGRVLKLVPSGTVLATLPAEVAFPDSWCFDKVRRILVTGLGNGDVLFHELVV